MQKLKLIILSISIIALTVACEKEEPYDKVCGGHRNNSSQINDNDLRNMFFKNNTYWVFVDSINSQVDSVYVNYSGLGTMSDIRNNTYQIYSISTTWGTYTIVPGGLFYGVTGNVGSGENIYSSINTIVLDSIFVYDKYYYDVHKTTYSPYNSEVSSIYYINSEFGFIRRDVIHASSGILSKKFLMRKNIVR